MRYIGCSGYYYPYWKNKFYPAELQPKGWLEYYSSVFNTVELNGTFYRIPKAADLERYAAMTSSEFRFSVKMSKFITHIQRLSNCTAAVEEFQRLIRSGLDKKLLHFLFQLPPGFHYSEENLETVLETIPHDPENVVEFRHISWWNETVERALRDANITFCNVDFPGLQSHFIHTTPCFYFRLHGNPVLFKSAYEQAELETFYRKIPPESAQQCIYFNNTYYDAGYTNALQLKNFAGNIPDDFRGDLDYPGALD